MLNGGGSPRPILISQSTFERTSGVSSLSFSDTIPADCELVLTCFYCRHGGTGSSAGSGTVTGTLSGSSYTQQTGSLFNSRAYSIIFMRHNPATGSQTFTFNDTRNWSGAIAVQLYFKNVHATVPILDDQTSGTTGTTLPTIPTGGYTFTNKSSVVYTASRKGSIVDITSSLVQLEDEVAGNTGDTVYVGIDEDTPAGDTVGFFLQMSSSPNSANSSFVAIQGR